MESLNITCGLITLFTLIVTIALVPGNIAIESSGNSRVTAGQARHCGPRRPEE